LRFEISNLKLPAVIGVETHKPIHAFTHLPIYSFTHLLIYPFIHSRATSHKRRLLPSTFVENPLQIDPFLCKTNPICRNTQMNVNIFSRMDYENKSNWTLGKNKPNQTQLPKRPKMNLNFYLIGYYENLPLRSRGQNKPKQTQNKPCPERSRMGQFEEPGSVGSCDVLQVLSI